MLIWLQLSPDNAEEFIAYLISLEKLDEAAIKLAEIINKEDFVSREGKSKHQVCVSNWPWLLIEIWCNNVADFDIFYCISYCSCGTNCVRLSQSTRTRSNHWRSSRSFGRASSVTQTKLACCGTRLPTTTFVAGSLRGYVYVPWRWKKRWHCDIESRVTYEFDFVRCF